MHNYFGDVYGGSLSCKCFVIVTVLYEVYQDRKVFRRKEFTVSRFSVNDNDIIMAIT